MPTSFSPPIQSPAASLPSINHCTGHGAYTNTCRSRSTTLKPLGPTPPNQTLHVPSALTSTRRQRPIFPLYINDWRTRSINPIKDQYRLFEPSRARPWSPTPDLFFHQISTNSPSALYDLEHVVFTHLSCASQQIALISAVRTLTAAMENPRNQLSQPLLSERLQQDLLSVCTVSDDYLATRQLVHEEEWV